MKTRYRLIRRGVRGGAFYCVDNKSGKRTSLRTGSEDEARQIVEAKNQAERQPVLNLIETQPEHFLDVLESGSVSTNNYLRRFHNFALDVGWLLRPVLPKRQWPAIRYREKRAITREEHALILSRENNPEMSAFLWCCWHIGGSQSDVARLRAEDIDWETQVVSFFRSKTGTAQIIHFG